MNKKKFFCQTMICLLIFTLFLCGSKTKVKGFSTCYRKAENLVMTPLSAEDAKNAVRTFSSAVADGSQKVISAMIEINEPKYGDPVDEHSDSEIEAVHAVAGGRVIRSGYSEALGLYVKIRHEDAVSVYGNLDDVNVVEQDRVQRGEVIGTYDQNNPKDFYFHFDENL